MRRRLPAGFTLVELLITVAIIGILAAIALVNYTNAIDRARQRGSMAEIRGVATALEAYAIDLDRYPPAAAFTLPPDLPLPAQTLQVASGYIHPTYIRVVPLIDGWNSWFLYGTNPRQSDYAIRTTGRGGAPETAPVYGPTTSFQNDIILVNGKFVQWPEGVQY